MAQTTAASTQQHINIAQIKDGLVITRAGDLRAVLEVTPVNFALRSEEDQNVIIGQYQSFLNSLTFPTQIVIQSRKLDLHPYLNQLEQAAERQSNELLHLQITEYIEFIRRLATLVNIMDKKFYIVIPFTPPPTQKAGGLKNLFAKKQFTVTFSPQQFAQYKQLLDQRISTIETGLNSMGLKTTRLTSRQLIELYYYVYNPEEAVEERLTEDVAEMAAPIIKREAVTGAGAVAPQPTPPVQAANAAVSGAPQPATPTTVAATEPTPTNGATVENRATIMNQ